MRKISFIKILLLLFLACMYMADRDAYANDAPHDLTNNIDCATMCHVTTGPAYPWTTIPTGTPTLDDTSYNHQCAQCHNTGPSIYDMTQDAQNVKTHSSYRTSTQYGNWSIECRTCHDPHAQKQVQTYSISAVDTILTGSLASFSPGYDAVTVTTATPMTPNAYYGYILVPNKTYPTDYYRIIGNTIDTFIVTTSNTLDPTYWPMSSYLDTVGNTFVVRYPNLVKSTVVNPAGQSKTVRFFNNSGPNSFATNTTTIDGICQVCHTKTKYFRNSGNILDQGHPASAGVNCTNCHQHASGFKATCSTCHGNPPINNTPGGPTGLVSNGSITTGSALAGDHAVHAVTKAISCDSCHYGSVGSGNYHNTGVTQGQIKIAFVPFSMQTLSGGSYDGQTTATYTTTGPETLVSKNGSITCSNVYCHSNAKKGTAVYSTASFSWNGAGPLACNACHGRSTSNGMPDYTNGGNGTNTANSHPKHVVSNGFTCNKCHYQTTQDGVSIWAGSTKHVNGTIQDVYFDPTTGGSYNAGTVQTCSATYCHGTLSPAWGSSGPLACNSCHGANSNLAGKHAKHYGTTDVPTSRPGAANNSSTVNYIFNCSVCHDPGQTTHAGGPAVPPNQVAEVKFDFSIATSGGVTGVYAGGAWVAIDNNFNYTAGSCSSLYCHSDGRGGAPNNTSFTWNPASTLDCTGCHSYTSASGVPMASGSHSKHVASYTFACNRCHNATTTDGVTIADRTKHVNHTKDVAFDSMNTTTTSYGAGPNCANIYCHSNGTKASAPYTTPNTAAAWAGAMPSNCTGCHNGDATSTTVMNSGTHAKHINNSGFIGVNFTCDNCHSMTVASGTSRAILSGANSHVNKQIDVRFTALNAGATYTNDGHAPNGVGSYSGCSSLYCHSNGKGTSTIVVWGGGSIGCNGCHGASNAKGYPDYANAGAGLTNANSHFKHADPTTHNIGCQECHLQTTTNGTAIRADIAPSLHINGITQDVTFDIVAYPTRSYAGASKTCSNISCHNVGGGSTPTPQWGATLNCTSCHGFPPSTGAHLTHVQSTGALTQVYGSTENKSVGATYAFGCGNCHPTANALHGNGTVTVLLTTVADGSLRSKNSTTAAYSNLGSQNGKCSAIYCHSSGNNTSTAVASAASPSWGTTMSLAMNGNVCGGCHGNPPQYASQSLGGVGANSHYNNLNFMGREGGHLITIHWDNVFSKATGSGLVSQNSTSESSHGYPGVATTMTCDICHNATVDSTTKDTYAMKGTGSLFECANCHNGGTPTPLQSGAILDKSKHVNGSVDIQFKNASINSKAQLRSTAVTTQWTRNGAYGSAGSYDSTIQSLNSGSYNAGSKTCTVDCHNDLPVQWGDQTATCYTCHTALPQ